jgi:hypothetical protein
MKKSVSHSVYSPGRRLTIAFNHSLSVILDEMTPDALVCSKSEPCHLKIKQHHLKKFWFYHEKVELLNEISGIACAQGQFINYSNWSNKFVISSQIESVSGFRHQFTSRIRTFSGFKKP